MTTPTCGHTDGWCGGVLGDNCVRDRRPDHTPEGMDEQDLWDQTHAQPYAHDDYHEGGTRWDYQN